MLVLDVLLGSGAIREIAAASQAQVGFRHEGCFQKGGVHGDDPNGTVQVQWRRMPLRRSWYGRDYRKQLTVG